MNKKILFVITKSNFGGAQRYVYDLSVALKDKDFPVAVALGGTGKAGEGPGSLNTKLEAAGVRTLFVPSFVRDVSLLREINAVRELYRIFKKEQPDIVHLNSSKAGGLGALAARLAGVPRIVFTVHGLPWDENRSLLARIVIYIATRLTFLLSHRVITISKDNYTRARACLLCRHNIVLIHNGIAPMEFGSGSHIREAFPPGVHITGTIGELNRNKNQISLIDEARKNPTMYVAIVGEGELRNFLENKIKEYGLEKRVKLFGFIPAAEALKGFDAFSLPSIKEGLPYVLLEARLAGLPITANRAIGGIAEILDSKDMSEFSLSHMVNQTLETYLSIS